MEASMEVHGSRGSSHGSSHAIVAFTETSSGRKRSTSMEVVDVSTTSMNTIEVDGKFHGSSSQVKFQAQRPRVCPTTQAQKKAFQAHRPRVFSIAAT